MSGRQQYRVSWRRRGWAPTTWNKSKTFPTEGAAIRFVKQLEGEWADASPAENISIDVRDVTLWRPYTGRNR